MKRSDFEKYSKQGKTCLCMDFVEGKEELCTTGMSGSPALILDQIARKVAYIFLQIQVLTKCDVVKYIDVLADNIKAYYAKFIAAQSKAQKGKERGKSK